MLAAFSSNAGLLLGRNRLHLISRLSYGNAFPCSVAQAAEFPGYAGKFDCFLERIVMQQFVSIHLS